MVCTNSSQTNPGMEIWAQNLTQNKELVYNWYLLIKELSSVFCNKVTLGISITLQSRSPAQVEQQKIRAVSCLCVCFLWFGDFLFFFFLYVGESGGPGSFERESEHEVASVLRWRRSGRIWGGKIWKTFWMKRQYKTGWYESVFNAELWLSNCKSLGLISWMKGKAASVEINYI